MSQVTDVYIISGFLGSGKTTVLKRLVEDSQLKGKKVGIILNELGDTNVESHLFKTEKMVELLNGCICCSMQEDLKLTLHQFIDNSVDILLIEGTGVANPSEIVEAITAPVYIDHFAIRSIISLVDASQYLEYQSIFSSSKEIRTLLKEQINCASLIVLNKTDLVTEKKLEKILASIRKTTSVETPIIKSTFGDVAMNELLLSRVQTLELTKEAEQPTCSCHSDDCNHKHDHQHATLKAVKLTDVPKFTKKEFEAWLKQLPNDVIRGKGIITFNDGATAYSFQYSSGRLYVEEVETSQPSIIILIGDRLDSERIKESYRLLLQNK